MEEFFFILIKKVNFFKKIVIFFKKTIAFLKFIYYNIVKWGEMGICVDISLNFTVKYH